MAYFSALVRFEAFRGLKLSKSENFRFQLGKDAEHARDFYDGSILCRVLPIPIPILIPIYWYRYGDFPNRY